MQRVLILVLGLLAIGCGGAAYYHYRQQSQLHQQLIQLTAVLDTENCLAMRKAENTIKAIQATVAKNRAQPVDVAALQRAEALQSFVNQLIAQLHNYASLLRHGAITPPLLRQQRLQQRAAAYADTLRHLGMTAPDARPLAVPVYARSTPLVEALADLSQLESELLTYQSAALQRIAKSIQARSWLAHPLAAATAASNVVAPGNTYRAYLKLVGYYSANELNMQMTCNGRPVPAGPNGTGLVRFRASTRPGPATWTGTIRLNQNGRDTTFRVTVPYRIVRR